MSEPPIEVRVVSDPAALKALADPLRLRIIDLLGAEPERLWTVKELAMALDQPVTKLYHHVKLLASTELIRDADTRVVSGIVEHRYACAQRSITLDEGLFGVPANREAGIAGIAGVIDRVRNGLLGYLRRTDADFTQVTLGHAVARLTATERTEVMSKLSAVIDDIQARGGTRDRRRLARYSVAVVMHPVPNNNAN